MIDLESEAGLGWKNLAGVVHKRTCFWCVWRAFDEGSSLGNLDVFDFLGEDAGSLAKRLMFGAAEWGFDDT